MSGSTGFSKTMRLHLTGAFVSVRTAIFLDTLPVNLIFLPTLTRVAIPCKLVPKRSTPQSGSQAKPIRPRSQINRVPRWLRTRIRDSGHVILLLLRRYIQHLFSEGLLGAPTGTPFPPSCGSPFPVTGSSSCRSSIAIALSGIPGPTSSVRHNSLSEVAREKNTSEG